MLFLTVVLALVFPLVSPTPLLMSAFFTKSNLHINRLCKNGILSHKAPIHTSADCAMICLTDGRCLSYLYNREIQACHTVNQYLTRKSNCRDERGYKYYTKCPLDSGYIYDRMTRMCFKYYDNNDLIWPEARKVCLSENSDLIKLDTQDKRDTIRNYLQSIGSASKDREYFLGGYYSENVWRWVADNSTVEGFTKDDDKSSCLEMESINNFEFDDTSCKTEYQRYFCEVPMTLIH